MSWQPQELSKKQPSLINVSANIKSVTMDILESVLIKFNKANDDAQSLFFEINELCNKHPIKLDSTLRKERLGYNLTYNMEGLEIPFKKWSIDLGVVIYSLRSALDNLIYVCAQQISDPPKQPEKLQFPIFNDKISFKGRAKTTISQLPVEIADLLERIQPFQRNIVVRTPPPIDPLSLLNWMSNHDKHRMPIPFLIPPKIIKWTGVCQFETENDAKANTPPDTIIHADPIRHGNLFLEYKTKHPIVMLEGAIELIAKVEINTPHGNLELVDTVEKIICYCGVIINEFSTALRGMSLSK